MYEHRSEPMLSRPMYLRRVAQHGGVAGLITVVSLAVGMLGYHLLAGQSWVDSFLNSAMLLGGMGPVGDIGPTAGKLFAACYALYAGFVFIVVAGLLIAPLFHRILHRFHLEVEEEKRRRSKPAGLGPAGG
ncbi:MAG TPA: hypothetical protein VJN95_13155 [Gemmatimonadales bacterium]|nr:hypothetical protein [Gemmatimonadales bacterium]